MGEGDPMGGDGGPQSDPPRAERDTLDAMIEAALSQTHATPDRRVIFVDGFNVLHAVLAVSYTHLTLPTICSV